LAHDPRVFVRDAAAEALGAIGGEDGLDALAKASVADVDEWVRETAAISAINSPK
jgi:HEAT repeat protein